MAKIVTMATYPKREAQCQKAIASLAPQVDRINLTLNEYKEIPAWVAHFPNVHPVIPDTDLKDIGKFLPIIGMDDDVFLCDDDILYPADYTQTLCAAYEQFAAHRPIVGVHGIIYSDFFDGNNKARLVYVFKQALTRYKLVNQLGTGTVHCKGFHLPSLSFMETSAQFADVRFGVHAKREGYPMICVKRPADWLKQLPIKDSIFHSFTMQWPAAVIKEAQEIAGFSKLPHHLVPLIEG